jgi:DNA-binding XRE family transcriptional regulator
VSSHALPAQPPRVGQRIAAARREHGFTQKQLAERLGVSVWLVDQLEAGAVAPDRYLEPIAEATSVAVDRLREGDAVPAATAPGVTSTMTTMDALGRAAILGAIVVLVVVRFFTEVVPVVPRAANFVDIPIFLALATLAAFAPLMRQGPGRFYLRFGFPSVVFLCLCVGSAVINFGRIAPAPVLVFVYTFLAPVGVYAAAYRLWPAGNASALSRTLVGLGVLELLVVALIDLPRFVRNGNPDEISGTFGTNAYQLVVFLLIFLALLVGVATFERQRPAAHFAPLLALASFATILLAQYRSLLVSMAVAMVVVAVLLGRGVRGAMVVAVCVILFATTFYYVTARLPALKLESAASSLATNPGTYVSGRLGVAENVFRLYGDIPLTIAAGSGPGTYSSRAWQTFAKAGSESQSNVAGSYATRLVQGETYTTDVSEKYVIRQIRRGRVVEGSHAITSPYSSYAALLAEVGVVGFALIVAIYVAALGRAWRMARVTLASPVQGDPLPALALATVVAFVTLLQMGLLESWLEVTRITFVVWALLAVVTKEIDARGNS